MTKYRLDNQIFDSIEDAEDYAVEHGLIPDEDVAAELSEQYTPYHLVLTAGADYDLFVEYWDDAWWDIFNDKVERIEVNEEEDKRVVN